MDKHHGFLRTFVTYDRKKIYNFYSRSDTPKRPHNPADVYYRQTRPDIYNNIGMVNENGEKWKELRNQLTPPLTKTPQNYASQVSILRPS
jgi:hypothetical protein